MKVGIFGLTISSSWGNGHATLWRGLCRALTARGHRIVFFERDVPYYASHRDMTEIPGGALHLYSDWDQVLSLAKRELADADVAMVTSYCPDGIAASELVLSSQAEVRAFYDLDTPVTLDRLRMGEPVPYLPPQGLGNFDLVLSFTGGETIKELKRQLGARRVVPLYGSVDPDVHRAVPPVEWYRSDLSYLGTYAADRQEMLRKLFIEPARQLPKKRFLIGGAQYPSDFPWTENIYFAWHIPPPDHAAFYSSSNLTLNITRAAMAQMGYCPSGRLFEAAACGTPILSDWWEGLEEFFEPGTEILVARTTEDAMNAIEMGKSELAMAKVAKAARERTLAQHTCECRALDFERAIEAAGKSTSSTPRLRADGQLVEV